MKMSPQAFMTSGGLGEAIARMLGQTAPSVWANIRENQHRRRQMELEEARLAAAERRAEEDRRYREDRARTQDEQWGRSFGLQEQAAGLQRNEAIATGKLVPEGAYWNDPTMAGNQPPSVQTVGDLARDIDTGPPAGTRMPSPEEMTLRNAFLGRQQAGDAARAEDDARMRMKAEGDLALGNEALAEKKLDNEAKRQIERDRLEEKGRNAKTPTLTAARARLASAVSLIQLPDPLLGGKPDYTKANEAYNQGKVLMEQAVRRGETSPEDAQNELAAAALGGHSAAPAAAGPQAGTGKGLVPMSTMRAKGYPTPEAAEAAARKAGYSGVDPGR